MAEEFHDLASKLPERCDWWRQYERTDRQFLNCRQLQERANKAEWLDQKDNKQASRFVFFYPQGEWYCFLHSETSVWFDTSKEEWADKNHKKIEEPPRWAEDYLQIVRSDNEV